MVVFVRKAWLVFFLFLGFVFVFCFGFVSVAVFPPFFVPFWVLFVLVGSTSLPPPVTR